MRRNIHIITILATVIFSVVSCHSIQDAAYFSDARRNEATVIKQNYNTLIHAGDRLYIHVDSEEPASALAFNQETNKLLQGNQTVVQADRAYRVEGYLVSSEGTINFPMLGKMKVVNLTHDELSTKLTQALRDKGYINDPTVTVRLMNFRVAVLGEVKQPLEIHIDGERLTILEALAEAGDITIYGKRDKVSLVRDTMGGTLLVDLDLTKSDFLNTPYYYLQPNDIVFVEANKLRKKQARTEKTITEANRIANIIKQTAIIIQRSTQIIDQTKPK
ncbi:MAG: polysaccharide biosynthesis/export family protein [Bacteroidales bacterium]|nr:polysaccharide biosynthesis/export family protein [Bacteroidales bacterium]